MRPLLAAVVAAGAVLVPAALTACSSEVRPGAAAVVDGRVIDASDVDEAADDLATVAGGRAGAVSTAITAFAVEDDLRRLGGDFGVVASADDAREVFRPEFENQGLSIDDVGEDALAVLTTLTIASRLNETPEGVEAVNALFSDLDVEVNPRYGTAATTEEGIFFVDVPQTPWVTQSGS